MTPPGLLATARERDMAMRCRQPCSTVKQGVEVQHSPAREERRGIHQPALSLWRQQRTEPANSTPQPHHTVSSMRKEMCQWSGTQEADKGWEGPTLHRTGNRLQLSLSEGVTATGRATQRQGSHGWATQGHPECCWLRIPAPIQSRGQDQPHIQC